MAAEEFGQYVAALRMDRDYLTDKKQLKKWTQKYLAEKAQLTKKQISDIEQGRFANWAAFHDKVVRLSNAFGLNEKQKTDFYAKAGFVYSSPKAPIDRTSLKNFLEEIPYPAMVRNPIWDYIAFNRFHIATFNFTEEVLHRLDSEPELGANNLRMIYDDSFLAQTSVKHERWHQEVIETFRLHSFPYIHTKRYQTLIGRLKERYSTFRTMWALFQATGETMPAAAVTPRTTHSIIRNQVVGEISFMSMRIVSIYVPDNLLVTVYMPSSPKDEEKFQSLRKTVPTNNVHFFREYPLE
jgi:transcriptional regulator with XRE-family HTH domain